MLKVLLKNGPAPFERTARQVLYHRPLILHRDALIHEFRKRKRCHSIILRSVQGMERDSTRNSSMAVGKKRQGGTIKERQLFLGVRIVGFVGYGTPEGHSCLVCGKLF